MAYNNGSIIKIMAILLVVSIFAISGCKGNSLSEKAVEQGKLAMADHEYSKALSSFELAVDEGLDDDEVIKMIDIIEGYDESKRLLDEEKIDEAEKVLNAIDGDYKKYAIKNDINDLAVSMAKLKEELEVMSKEVEDVEEDKEEKTIEKKAIISVEDAKEIVLKDLNKKEYGARHEAEMDEVIDGITYYLIDRYSVEGEFAATAMYVNSKDGSIYSTSEIMNLGEKISTEEAHQILIEMTPSFEEDMPNEYEYLIDGGYAHEDKYVLDNYHIFAVLIPYEYQDGEGNTIIEYNILDSNYCVDKNTGEVKEYFPGMGFAE